jgi:hypothetical protein
MSHPQTFDFDRLAACDPYGPFGTGLPNLVSEILQVWSYRPAHSEYQSENLKLDCGMMFRKAAPAAWIESVIPIDDAEFRSS